MYDTDTNKLIGRFIFKATITDDGTSLILSLDKGEEAIFGTHGDCCSRTWIENCDVPGDLRFGGKVLELTQVMNGNTPLNGEETTNGDVIAYYGMNIKTSRGVIAIDYRNDSNGYYGGHLTGPNIRPRYGD